MQGERVLVGWLVAGSWMQLVARQSWRRNEVLVEHLGQSQRQAGSWMQAVGVLARFRLRVRALRVEGGLEVVEVEEGRKGLQKPRGRSRRRHCRTPQFPRLQ